MSTTGYLSRLAARSTQPTGRLRPRAVSPFEQSLGISVSGSKTVEAGAVSRPGVAPIPADQQSAALTEPQRHLATAHSEPRTPQHQEAARQGVVAAHLPAGEDVPAVAAALTPAGQPGPFRLATFPVDAEREAQADAPATPQADAAPVPPRLDPAAPSPSIATRAGVDRPPLLPPSPPTRPSLLVPGRGSQSPRRPGDSTNEQAVPTEPPGAATVLPRIHPPVSVGPPANPPGVTVTIGRIEVLPPVTPKPAPPRTTPRKAPTAPGLRDYLRDRSGR